jgi:pantothenate kinase
VDGGKTYKKVKVHKLMASFFFLSDDVIKHSRSAYLWLQLIASYGGLYKLIMGLTMQILVFKYNKKHIIAKFIRGLYYFGMPIEKQMRIMGINANIVSDEKIQFDLPDEISHLWRKIFFWKKNIPDEEFYSKS